MKIVNILLFVLIFLLGIFILNEDEQKQWSLSAFLPTDTQVYFEQSNGQEFVERFRHSRLGRVVRSLDYPQILKDAGLDQRITLFLQVQRRTLEALADDRLVTTLLGRKYALALLGPREWSVATSEPIRYLKQHLLLISRPLVRGRSFKGLLNDYLHNRSVTTTRYGRYEIQRIVLAGGDVLALAEVSGFVLCSLEERVVRESLDLHDRKKPALNTQPAFLSFSQEMEGAELFVYCAVAALQRQAQALAQDGATILGDGGRELVSLTGIRRVAYGGWRQPNLMKKRIIIGLNHETMDARLRQMMENTPTLNFSLPYVSRDVLLYYWSNSLELKMLWDMYTSRFGADSREVVEMEKEITRLFGHDVDGLIQLLGSNIAIMVRENKNENFVPIPDFAILLKLRDSQATGKAMRQALNKLDIKTKAGTYRKVKYFSWGIDPNESLQPVYAIHRDYLIFANTLNILQIILDTPVNNTRLVASKGFKAIDPGFQTLNNSVCYIDQVRLLRRLQEFVGWAGLMLAIQDREAAEKTKTLIDNLLDPLFDGLSMYEQSATRTYLKGGRVYIESQIRYAK
ncbi:MAG: hypothetical protein ACK5PS_18515 [Desulfopila sp.]